MQSSKKTNKVIWFQKAKCAGTSFESIPKKNGHILYVGRNTTREELENNEIKIICIRGEMPPSAKGQVRQPDGTYERKRECGFFWRFRNDIFVPKQFMIEKFPDVLQKWPKFAIVRNPYDKFISSWKYIKSLHDLPLEEVLSNLPDKSNQNAWLHITKTQKDYIIDNDGNPIIDRVVYMEDGFNEEINEILNSVSLQGESLPELNKSTRKPYTEYLTPDIRNKILDIYREDFDFFGYSYDENIAKPIKKWKK